VDVRERMRYYKCSLVEKLYQCGANSSSGRRMWENEKIFCIIGTGQHVTSENEEDSCTCPD